LTRILIIPLNLGIFSEIRDRASVIRFRKSWSGPFPSPNSPSASGAFRFPAFGDLQTGSLTALTDCCLPIPDHARLARKALNGN
jgi:hypothetical protein